MTSVPSILPLANVRDSDLPLVGGKAAGLGELLGAGVRVPDGVVVTARAAAMSLEERAAVFANGDMPTGEGPYAVRSSAIGEDGARQSFAGMYESVLGVSRAGLRTAIERVLASADHARATAYASGQVGAMAVIVQQMVRPAAAGVAFTADAITGDRSSTTVSAVRGFGDKLVSGSAYGDEWVVKGREARLRRGSEDAISASQAAAIAQEARRIAEFRGSPQDVEWAIDHDGALWILQARPMTALPPEVSWEPPVPGGYTRQFRFGEWISEPVTPLFESWLLTAMEERMHALLQRYLGQHAPPPHHVVVNGWYFYSLNWASPSRMARNMPRLLWHVARDPRRTAGILPATVRHSIPLFERDWREDLQPRYRAAVASAADRVETAPTNELPRLIDELATLAGEYFTSIAALAGAGYKTELNLSRFYLRHLHPSIGGSHLPLLAGLAAPSEHASHAVASLDWWFAPMTDAADRAGRAAVRARLVARREAAEAAALQALSGSRRRLRTFQRLLADAQHVVPIREEQTAELTIAWPTMRRAVLRIGEALVVRGVIGTPHDVFFLRRDEVLSTLVADSPMRVDVTSRRMLREEQAKLVPPLVVGQISPVLDRMWKAFPRMLGAEPSQTALVTGSPASAGRATGTVRVIRGPSEFDSLEPGDILVAPLTAPAWTPLFTRAAGVVTDVGSPAAHASIIAREYGIPAIVGTGDATARLRSGMRVTIDGSTGNVEPAQHE